MDYDACNEERVRRTMTSHLDLPSSQAYQCRKSSLLREEAEQSWDYLALCSASALEVQASEIVWRLREEERVLGMLFGDIPGETLPHAHSRDMGGRFLVNKERIEASDLFQIALRMPKGCHLHVHLNSELPGEVLLEHVREFPDTIFLRSSKRLIDLPDLEEAEIVFDVFPKDCPSANIFAETYRPRINGSYKGCWMKWAEFCSLFPKFMGSFQEASKAVTAEAWVLNKLTFNKEMVYGASQTLNGVWARYNQCTRAVKGLLACESLFRWYIEKAIEYMLAENIFYSEWRHMLMNNTIATDDGNARIDAAQQMGILEDVLARKKDDSLNHRFLGIKVIYCIPRSITLEEMWSQLKNIIELKQKYRDLICGFDLVGAEDRPYSIGYYAHLLEAFQCRCTELGLCIPFMPHAGETVIDTGGTSFASNSNLYDAILLNAKRIGHGVSLTRHPILAKRCRLEGIALEVCPISNELLHLCTNIKEHRLSDLLALGLPCTISADNPLIFKSTLSHNFYQVMTGIVSMNLSGCRQLVEWSIEHSCLENDQKVVAKERLRSDWDDFLHLIINSYGQ